MRTLIAVATISLYLASCAGQAGVNADQAKDMDSLVRQLFAPTIDARISASGALVKIGEPAVNGLLSVRDSRDCDARLRAYDAILKIGPPAARPVVARIGQERLEGRGAPYPSISDILIPMGEPAVSCLIDVISGKAKGSLEGAAEMLGIMRAKRAVPSLILLARAHEPEAAKSAVQALGAIGDPRASAALIQVWNQCRANRSKSWSWGGIHDSDLIRALGGIQDSDLIQAMGGIQDPKLTAFLAKLAKDPCNDNIAVSAMAAMGQAGVVPLCSLLQKGDEYQRTRVVGILGYRRGPRALQPLIGALHDKDPGVRLAAVNSLTLFRDPRAVEALIGALAHKDPEVRKAAVAGLGSLGVARATKPLGAMLISPACEIRASVVRYLGQLKPPALDLIEPLVNDSDPKVRAEAISALADHRGSDAIPLLIAATSDSDKSVRGRAFSNLGISRDPRVGPAMIPLLSSEYPGVRAGAAEVIRRHPCAEAVEPLKKLLDDPTPGMKRTAEAALLANGFKGSNLIDIFEKDLRNEDSNVRWDAAINLGKAGTDRSVDILAGALADRRPIPEPPKPAPSNNAMAMLSVHSSLPLAPEEAAGQRFSIFRRSAARALGMTHNLRAVRALIPALRDTDPRVRENAAEALGVISSADATDALIAALRDTDVFVRRNAATSLGSIADTSAVTPLIELLVDVYFDARTAAAQALAKMNSAQADQALLDALGKNNMQAVAGAYSFFIAMGVPGSEPILIEAMGPRTSGEDMIRAYAYSGNARLAAAAKKEWKKHYQDWPMPPPGKDTPKWGSRRSQAND